MTFGKLTSRVLAKLIRLHHRDQLRAIEEPRR